jgi:peptidoglycan biosynthesis protein MviN/MurJ (putative lipid II flippase)
VIIGNFARGYFARLIYTNGNQQISIIFGFLAAAILFRIIYALMSRWFYAQKDTKTPLFVSLFTIALNITLAYTLAKPSAYGVAGLALAQSIVAGIEVVILGVIMLIRDPKLFDATFWGGVFRIVSVSGFSVVAGFIMISLYPLQIKDTGILVLGTKLAFISAVTFATHVSISALFGLEEVRPVFSRIRRIILKPIKVGL